MSNAPPISLDLVVRAYTMGAFPMATGRHGQIRWYSPDPRAILPLDAARFSRSLLRRVRSGKFEITFDTAFEDVIRGCAQARRKHEETWINEDIIRVYTQLHQAGVGHSVEAWLRVPDTSKKCKVDCKEITEAAVANHPFSSSTEDKNENRVLVGGLYGLALGGAFFGESMFSRVSDASKVCLVHLVEHLRSRGYALLDTQIANSHMQQFGIIEIPRSEYLDRLTQALDMFVSW